MSKHPENPYKNYEDYLAKSPFQTIKLLLPFLPAANQKTMIILIKFMELKYTMDYFKKGNQLSFSANLPEDASPLEKFSAIIDFLPPKEQESVEQMLSMMSVMEAFQTMTGDDEDSEESFEPEETSYEEESHSTAENLHSADVFPDEPLSSEEAFPSEEGSEPEEIAASSYLTPSDSASDSDALSDIKICSNIEF